HYLPAGIVDQVELRRWRGAALVLRVCKLDFESIEELLAHHLGHALHGELAQANLPNGGRLPAKRDDLRADDRVAAQRVFGSLLKAFVPPLAGRAAAARRFGTFGHRIDLLARGAIGGELARSGKRCERLRRIALLRVRDPQVEMSLVKL